MHIVKKVLIAAAGAYVGINFIQQMIPATTVNNILPNADLYLAVGAGVVLVDHFI